MHGKTIAIYCFYTVVDCTLLTLHMSNYYMLRLRGGSSRPQSQRLYADYSTALSEDIPSFRRTIARGQGQRPAMKMRPTQWQSPYKKHQVVESNVDIHSGACEGKQNGWRVRQYSCQSNFVVPRRVCYEKHLFLRQAIASLRQFVGLPGRFVNMSDWQVPPPPTTVTLRRKCTEG